MRKVLALALGAACLSANAQTAKLADEIPYPFHAVHSAEKGQANKLLVLNSGIAALEKRLELIRNARKHIEVEYFIYALDASSKILTAELVKAAKRGVKVRMLVDKSSAVFVLDEYYAKALKEAGIEVRYYNNASLLRISTINFRNHRKLLSADDKHAITGGRNVEDDYYDFSDEFNFLDRDVYIEGPMAKTMRETFDLFFEHEITERPSLPERPADEIRRFVTGHGRERGRWKMVSNKRAVKKHEKRMEKARAFLKLNDKEKALAAKASDLGKKVLADRQPKVCPELTFASDSPGGNFATRLFDEYGDEYRFLRKVLFDKAAAADKGIVISSPYMINSPKSMEIYNLLLDKGVDITLYTNSMASTDALYVAANLYRTVFSWDRLGINTYVHAGKGIAETETLRSEILNAKWGTHSKTQLYESEDSSKNEFMIGTYNVDNRSNHYNTEMAVFCKGSPELYDQVKSNMLSRMNEGYQIHSNYTATDKNGNRVSVFGADKSDLGKMLLMALPSWLLNLLL